MSERNSGVEPMAGPVKSQGVRGQKTHLAEPSRAGQPTTLGALDVIIVNWNSGGQLQECLASIGHAGDEASAVIRRVIVVDNASSDGSAHGLDDIGLSLTIIRNQANRGFAAACNQAARQSDAELILFLNPDTRLLRNSITRPVRAMHARGHENIGIVGIQLIDATGKVTPTCARFLTPAMVARRILGLDQFIRGIWPSHFMNEWDHQETAEVDHVMGAFFLVRRSLFEQLGGLDERFFVYLEDLDFSLRAKQAGFSALYLTEAQAYHKGGGSSEGAKARSLYYAVSSRIKYGFKHFPGWKAWTLFLGTLMVEPVARIAYASLRMSGQRLRDTVVAFGLLWANVHKLIEAAGSRRLQ